MMDKTKVAVVGLGHAANDFHLPCLTRFRDVQVSLCDAWPDRLNESKAKWKIPHRRCFGDLDEMMDKLDPDAVYVTIPQYIWRGRKPSPHPQVVRSVLARGKPIFVEKPLAMNYPDAKALADAAEEAGVVTTQVGYQRRFNPLLREGLKRVYDKGPLLNCSFGFFKGADVYDPETNVIPIPPYDMLTLDMIHCLDLMQSVPKAKIVEFFSTTGRVDGEPELTQFHAMAKFDNGCTSIFTSNMRAGARMLNFQLHGIRISVYITMNPKGSHYSAMTATIFTDDDFQNPQIIRDYQVAPNRSSQACVGFWQENRHFIDCVKSGSPTECDFADALKTNELCEAVLKSS